MLEHEFLKFNAKSGRYEATFTISIEEEIYRRMFYKYVEESHIDLTDVAAVQKATTELKKVGKWLSHPRTEVAPYVPDVNITQPLVQKEYSGPVFARADTIPKEEEEELWEKLRQMPEEEWESVKPPLIDSISKEDKDKYGIYARRSALTKSFDRLRKEIEKEHKKANLETVKAISDSLNNNRLK